MKRFLDELAEHLIEVHGHRFENTVVVLPARRSGLFLKRALSRHSKHSGWLPELLTMTELTERMTGMQRGDGLDLTFDLFATWREHAEPDARLEPFLQWGSMALADFNEIDHQLADAKSVFKNLKDFKDIEAWSFGEDDHLWSENQKEYNRFWMQLGELYTQFNQKMTESQHWYGGAIARVAAKDPVKAFERLNVEHIVFAGLNALTAAEHTLIKRLVELGKATFWWDADRYYVHDKRSEAGLFVRRFPELDKRSLPRNFLKQAKTIKLVGCSGTVTQMHYVGEVLRKINPQEATETAVILSDNSVLPVLLRALPDHFEGVNITMGRTLSHTPYQSLVSSVFRLLDSRSKQVRHNLLLAFCRHPYIAVSGHASGKAMYRLANHVVHSNAVFVDQSTVNAFLANTAPNQAVQAFFDALYDALRTRTPKSYLSVLHAVEPLSAPGENDGKERLQGWNLLTQLNARMHRLIERYPVVADLREFERIYRKLFGQLQINLVGEPLIGLQIMGLLESRALDFKRVIIVNANEDILPRKINAESFLPNDLRAFLQLPNARERDAYYAYYFYRLIQRAEEVYITFTAGESHDEGERSRFVQQLETCRLLPESAVQVHHSQVMTANPAATPEIVPIETGEFTQQRVSELLQRGLSPSAFNKWLQNPREFFFRYILSLGEQNEIEEEIESNTLGTIVHEVVETIFEAFINVELDADALRAEKQRLETLVDEKLEKFYNLQLTKYGVNYLLRRVALNFAEKLIDISANEAEQHKVVVTALEARLSADLSKGIVLSGKADRVDHVQQQLRIVDYKTGGVDTKELALPADWQLKLLESPKPKLMQCLIYAWIAAANSPNSAPIAGIISSRNYSSGFMTVTDGKTNRTMTPEFAEAFGTWMSTAITDLAQQLISIPFDPEADYPEYTQNLGE